MRPTVSVVLAAYNATWCIERALDSVMCQTAPVAEVVLCDDGSTDGTPELVERRYGMRVRVLRLPHRNAAAARSEGLAAARADWLAFMDADDWWEPNKIERQLGFIESHPDIAWISSDGDFLSAEGVLRPSWLSDYFDTVEDRVGDLFPLLVPRCFPLMSSSMVRRDAYVAVGGMDPTIAYSHDYELWLRVSARYPAALMADRLVHYWYHEGSLSRRMEARHRDDLEVMRRVAAGRMREDAPMQRLAAVRASALAFDIAILCMREGRMDEARGLFRAAAAAGPASRRAFARAGALLPGFALPLARRMSWLKDGVAGARERKDKLPTGGGAA